MDHCKTGFLLLHSCKSRRPVKKNSDLKILKLKINGLLSKLEHARLLENIVKFEILSVNEEKIFKCPTLCVRNKHLRVLSCSQTLQNILAQLRKMLKYYIKLRLLMHQDILLEKNVSNSTLGLLFGIVIVTKQKAVKI